MPLPLRIRRRLLTALAVLGAWTVAGVFFATQHHLIAIANGEPDDLGERLFFTLVATSMWAALTPAVAMLADRFPLRRPHRLRNILVSLVVAAGAAAVRAPLDILVTGWLAGEPVPSGHFLLVASIALAHPHLLFALIVIGVTNFLRLRRETAERIHAAVRSRTELAEAKLRRLQGDLKPHFLFNSLNAVAALVHEDPAAAERMLDTLTGLLRRSMQSEDALEVPLSEELHFVEQYLEVQRTRFGDRLRTHTHVASPELLSCAIPPFMIQPLVENAIVHGVSRRHGGGCVEVHVRSDEEWLRVEVRDDGPGFDAANLAGDRSVGVPHTRARLAYLYGERQALTFRREEGAFVVDVRLPLRAIGSERTAHAL